MRKTERIAKSKETIKNITIPKLEEWRKSEEGQKRLKEYGQRLAQYQAERLVDAVCTRCGQPFKMHPTRGTGLCRRCGKLAADKRYYEKKKATREPKTHLVDVICTECGETYRTNPTTRNKDGLCRKCADRKRHRKNK